MCHLLDRKVVAEKDRMLYGEPIHGFRPPPFPLYEQQDVAHALLLISFSPIDFRRSLVIILAVLVLLCCVGGDINRLIIIGLNDHVTMSEFHSYASVAIISWSVAMAALITNF